MTKLSTRTLVRVGITTLALTLAACGGGGGSDGTDAQAPATAALSQATDCTDLLASIRADAREKIRVQADELRANGWSYSGGGMRTPKATGVPEPIGTPAPGAGPPRDATDTNTQVPGVDEADVVETDGERIYLLRDSELRVLPATPPEAMALGERVPIEGYALGMFVANGRALVVSAVTDDGTLGGDPRCDAIGMPFPTSVGWSCASSFVKLTLLDLGATPARVAREIYVEGGYVAARRHDMRARVIVQRFWGAPPGVADPWETLNGRVDEDDFRAGVDAWEAAAIATIDASALDTWLPGMRERIGGALVDRPLDCSAAHLAPPGHARQGTTLIVGMDLARDDGPLADTTLLGLASQIYANESTLVLAYPDWQAVPFGGATFRTALHLFSLPPQSLDATYLGSGFVPGELLSQFALDVRDDVVRVATYFWRALDGQPVTRVHTARLDDGELAIIGATGDMAPGETLQSARFLGDKAYLVTFLRVDPLFVVDLADPRSPRVLGEVEIPGFSEYLHPLDDRHLLTIGQGATGEVALQIFDVGDPTAPIRLHAYSLPREFSSPAQWNHLAFTYDRRLGLLALPLNSYSHSLGVQPDPPTLQLLAIDPVAGITLRGTVEHDPASPTMCSPPFDWEGGCFTYETMERGLFIGDVVYSIGNHEIRAYHVDDLRTSLAKLKLP